MSIAPAKLASRVATILGVALLAGGCVAPSPEPAPERLPTVEEPASISSTPPNESAPAEVDEVWPGQKEGWKVSSEGIHGQAEVVRSGETATLKVFAYLSGEYTDSGEPFLAPDGSELVWHLAGGEETFFGEGIATSRDGFFELNITAPGDTDTIDIHADMWIGSLTLPDGTYADPSLDYEIVYEVPQVGDEWTLNTLPVQD